MFFKGAKRRCIKLHIVDEEVMRQGLISIYATQIIFLPFVIKTIEGLKIMQIEFLPEKLQWGVWFCSQSQLHWCIGNAARVDKDFARLSIAYISVVILLLISMNVVASHVWLSQRLSLLINICSKVPKLPSLPPACSMVIILFARQWCSRKLFTQFL